MRPEHKNKLLRRKEDALMRSDIFVREPRVLSEVREALEAGLKPVAFSLIGDAVILRLERNEDAE
jgi:hypothetical protein